MQDVNELILKVNKFRCAKQFTNTPDCFVLIGSRLVGVKVLKKTLDGATGNVETIEQGDMF